jgi:hypothetical protein
MSFIVQNFVGGFGNQIFMMFNIISLSIDYNVDFYLNTTRYDHYRKDFTQYKLFQSDKLKRITMANFNNFNLVRQNGLKYNKFSLEQNKNYLIDKGNYGYFQCWQYFFHNKDKLKDYFNMYNNRFNELGNIIKNVGLTIAIHIRLTDYVGSNFYTQLKKNYYENILKKYNLDNYKIIIFSDDINNAKAMLNNIECIKNKDLIDANSITTDDEEQFILLAYTNIRICPNSSYSLTACYLTEIYDLVDERKYHFPNQWYNTSPDKFNIKELVNTTDPHFLLEPIN